MAWSPAVSGNEVAYFLSSKKLAFPHLYDSGLTESSSQGTRFLFDQLVKPLWYLGDLYFVCQSARVLCYLVLAFGITSLCLAVKTAFLPGLLSMALWMATGSMGFGASMLATAEPKVPAYGMFLLAIALLIQKRVALCGAAAGLATALHPIVGIWGFVSLFTAILINDSKQVVSLFKFLLWFSLLAFPLLFVAVTYHMDGSSLQEALLYNDIYVNFRHPHHLDPRWALGFTTKLNGFLVLLGLLAGIYFFRKERFARITFTLVLPMYAVGFLGLAAHYIGYYEFVKLYPFRFVSIFPTFFLLLMLGKFLSSPKTSSWSERLPIAFMLIVTSYILYTKSSVIRLYRRPVSFALNFPTSIQIHRLHPNRALFYNWIKSKTEIDAVFLTPIRMFDFSIYSERATFVNFKLSAVNVKNGIEWHRRLRLLNKGNKLPVRGFPVVRYLDRQIDLMTKDDLDKLRRYSRIDYFVSLKERPDLQLELVVNFPGYYLYKT